MTTRFHTPTRSCIACGQKNSPSAFLRIRLVNGGAQIGGIDGRSAYLCATSACVERAIAKRAFSRSFRANVHVSDELKQQLRAAIIHRADTR